MSILRKKIREQEKPEEPTPAPAVPSAQVFATTRRKNSDIFHGLSETKLDPGAFVFCRENALPIEWSWFAAKVRERVKRDMDARRVYVRCDKCGYRGESIGALLGSVCGRCTTRERKQITPNQFEFVAIEGHLVEMDQEEREAYLRDKARFMEEIKAKEEAARKVRKTISQANEGAAALYRRIGHTGPPRYPDLEPEKK